MAALLRSVRFLKFSPSGLLQVTGTKRTGPPLGRLYSGALGGGRTGTCLQLLSSTLENASSSRAWPYAVGCARRFAIATEKRDNISVTDRSKQVEQFDWALTKLDTSVRRTGRVTKSMLLGIFNIICESGYSSGNQALLLLRSCGSLLPEISLEERTVLAHCVWEKLQKLGVQFDVSHYNALLKVYLQNEFKFSPTDFLAKMEAANIQPNRVTYQRLIAAYCEDGNIEGASTILGFMKSENVPITEAVFNSMVTGHARAGDMESAKNILTVMRGAGIPPGPDTYVSLICAYAENGDIDNLKKTMEEAESEECFLMDRDIMQIIYSLAKAGHQQAIPEMVARMRHERGYVPDAMNLCLNLTTQKHEDTAFLVLKNFPILQTDRANASSDSISVGNFFLRHCVNIDVAVEKIIRYCTELQELDLHAAPHIFTLHCSLQAKKTVMSLELMQVIKEQGLPIRPHYFYPLLIPHVKSKNTAEVIELLKGMQQLGVSPDMETFSTYIYPTFPGIDEAREAIKEAGIKSKSFLLFEIRKLAVSNLAKFYAQISDPSFPSLDQHTFRSSLNIGFKMSDDVETMVKITELLHTDERFKTEDRSAGASVLLYSLINSMTQQEVQAQKEKLHRFFNQLKAKNITITQNFYKGISKLLVSYKVKDLITDLNGLIDTNEELSSGTKSPDVSDAETHTESMAPKRKLTSVSSKFSGSVLRRAILTACTNEDLQRALELKQKYEADMTPGCYAILVDQCCQLNNVEEALELKREMFCKDSSIALGTGKYISLVKALIKNNKVEEALDILKEMKEKEVVLNDTHITSLFHMLNSLVGKEGGGVTIRQLQETIFGLGLTKPTVNLCFPLISHYLDSNDLSGALDAVFECHKRYDFMPHMHDVLVSLVEKGDTELLQKAMDFVSQERGEMNMLYDLFFSFLQTGRYREARKIAETPGLRARPGRLQWYAERCIFTKQMEPLEQMVDMTAKLFECDRDEMYNYILRLCKEMNDWQRANAVWTKMQEENVIPRERTLHLLADILKSNGQQVPFELLEKWYEQTTPVEQKASTETNKYYKSRILDLCKEGNRQEALKLLKDAEKEGVSLSNKLYDHMIRMLLAQGEIEDAMMVRNMAMSHFPGFQLSNISSSLLIISNIKKGNIRDAMEQMKSMLQEKQTPLNVSVTRLVQALSNQGDLAGIQEVESLVKSLDKPLKVSSMLFISHEVMVHIRNGDLDTAVEQLESLYTSPDTVNPSISYVFRKILEEGNDKALDKLSVMAERLANHFACYRPAVDLFIQLVDMDKVEDAKFMLARCNAVAEQKEMLMSYVNKKTQTPGQVDKIKTLVNLIPDCLDKDLFDYYLMKCHIMDKDLASAKALYEQMQKDMVVKDELLLKRLAALYRESGETVPFEEPPKSFKFYIEKARNKNFKSLATAEE